MSEIVRMVVVLSLIAAVCSAVLTVAEQGLSSRIEQQTDYYVRGPALERLLGRPAEEVLNNKVVVEAGDQEIPIFFLKKDDKVTTLAIEAIGSGGYGGDIKLMFGVDLASGKQTGMEVVSHSETPGLGARIEEPGFRRQWQGLPVDSEIALTAEGGDIDAISGATFTSRAAIEGTNEVVMFLQKYADKILQSIAEREEQT